MENTTQTPIKVQAQTQSLWKTLFGSNKRPTRVKDTVGDQILEIVTTIILLLLLIVVAYPVIFVCSASLSSNGALMSGRVLLLPVEPTLEGYKQVFMRPEIINGYKNTIFFTFFGTLIKLFMKITCAYPLSKMHFKARNTYTRIIVLTMLVSAGMIPVFLIRTKLGLINNVWAILTSGMISASHVFILRTAFRSGIPGELFDAAAIDGANDFQSLVLIAIPLAKATISVITLYAIVGCWNEYFTALIYLGARQDLWPLQLHLRNLLVVASALSSTGDAATTSAQGGGGAATTGTEGLEMMRYAMIVVATVPVLIAYAVVQKYFKGGVMVGSVKG